MSWYEKKGAHDSSAVPLEDQECSLLSIYMVQQDGSVWTVDAHGVPHKKVRPASKAIPRDVLLCLCCKRQFGEMPEKHQKSLGE